ncbi:MAG: hypothetical protein JNL67_16840 [Planctomycetaceae bacterium]|nr:hypothetical protein [Planctomycetaceae bacterium]
MVRIPLFRACFAGVSVVVCVFGLLLWNHSRTLSPYKDDEIYTKRYRALEAGDYDGFQKLRQESLTLKYEFEDHGISLAVLGVLGLLLSLPRSFLLRSPPAFFVFTIVSVLLPFFSVGSYVYDIALFWERGAFPWWADSLIIGFVPVPLMFAIEFLWSLGHFLALNGADHPSTSLRHAFSFRRCWWFLLLGTNCVFISILALASGAYWLAIPNLCWLYFYLSLGAVYRVAKEIPRSAPRPKL